MDVAADELLSLLGRAARLARVHKLPVHLAFIEHMADTAALLGAEGYAVTSLQVRVDGMDGAVCLWPVGCSRVEDDVGVTGGAEDCPAAARGQWSGWEGAGVRCC
jgi:hypothetical protein